MQCFNTSLFISVHLPLLKFPVSLPSSFYLCDGALFFSFMFYFIFFYFMSVIVSHAYYFMTFQQPLFFHIDPTTSTTTIVLGFFSLSYLAPPTSPMTSFLVKIRSKVIPFYCSGHLLLSYYVSLNPSSERSNSSRIFCISSIIFLGS